MAVKVIVRCGNRGMAMRIVKSPFIGITQDLVEQGESERKAKAAPDTHLVSVLEIGEYPRRFLYPIRILIRMIQQLMDDKLAHGRMRRLTACFRYDLFDMSARSRSVAPALLTLMSSSVASSLICNNW